jgi:hypothetical protein
MLNWTAMRPNLKKVLALSIVMICASCTWTPLSKSKDDEPAECVVRSPESLISAVVQDMGNRSPNASELAWAKRDDFSPEAFFDYVATTSLYDDGLTKFISNIFRLESMPPSPGDEPGLIRDLQQEPVVLVLRNKDKPWKYFFETKSIFCSKSTAKLYSYPTPAVSGFSSCELPDERAGFLGMTSILRVTSPAENAQAFYQKNNNYHRAKSAVYFATGRSIEGDANGAAGEGQGMPLAECVPATDMRKSSDGVVFGTAAVPLEGPACASCHSRHMGPLSVAFRKFGPDGKTITVEDFEQLQDDIDLFGVSKEEMVELLKEDSSCWSPVEGQTPTYFKGIGGLGKVIAENADFGQALGIQIPTHMANIEADPTLIAKIKSAFDSGNQTLLDAMRGFFTSEKYTCN